MDAPGTQSDGRSYKPPIGTFVLLAVACVLYLGMLGSLSGLNETDAMGRGMALGFGAIFGVALWLVLAVLLLVAALNGAMPAIGKIGAALLLPFSAIAASVATDLYGGGAAWAFAVPLLAPPLIMIYALWARIPTLQTSLLPLPTTAIVGSLVVILALAPFVASLASFAPDPQQKAAQKAREEKLLQEEQIALRREAEVFARLGPGSSLRDYLQYLPGGDSRSHEALAGARLVKSRQEDAVELLKAGRLAALTDLFRLDLEAAPTLCKAYDDALASAASQVTKVRSDYLSVAIDLEQQLPNINWLTDGGCNLDVSLGLLADNVRSVADSQCMEKFAAASRVTIIGAASGRLEPPTRFQSIGKCFSQSPARHSSSARNGRRYRSQ